MFYFVPISGMHVTSTYGDRMIWYAKIVALFLVRILYFCQNGQTASIGRHGASRGLRRPRGRLPDLTVLVVDETLDAELACMQCAFRSMAGSGLALLPEKETRARVEAMLGAGSLPQ